MSSHFPYSIVPTSKQPALIAALANGRMVGKSWAEIVAGLGINSSTARSLATKYTAAAASHEGLKWPDSFTTKATGVEPANFEAFPEPGRQLEAEEVGSPALSPISGMRGDDSFEFDVKARLYHFDLAGAGRRTFTADEVQSWFSLYSRYADPNDKGVGVREICRSFNMTPSTFDRLKRVLDLTHQAAPFAPHRLAEESPESLVKETLQAREQRYVQALVQDEDKLIRERYDALIKERVSRSEWAKAIASVSSKPLSLDLLPPPCPPAFEEDPLGLGFKLADAHAAKKVLKGTAVGHGKDGMDKRIFVSRWDEMIEGLRRRYAGRNIQEAAYTSMGDDLESLLANMHWGHAGNVFEVGARQLDFAKRLHLRLIHAYLSILPEGVALKMIRIPGNHDRAGSDRHDDPYRTPWMILSDMLRESLYRWEQEGRIEWVFPLMPKDPDAILLPDNEEFGENRRSWAGYTIMGNRFLAKHGDVKAQTPEKLIASDQHDSGLAFSTYTILRAHLHGLEMRQKANWAEWLIPSFIGGDDYSSGQLAFIPYAAATAFECRKGDVFPVPTPIWLGQMPQVVRAA